MYIECARRQLVGMRILLPPVWYAAVVDSRQQWQQASRQASSSGSEKAIDKRVSLHGSGAGQGKVGEKAIPMFLWMNDSRILSRWTLELRLAATQCDSQNYPVQSAPVQGHGRERLPPSTQIWF